MANGESQNVEGVLAEGVKGRIGEAVYDGEDGCGDITKDWGP